VPEVAVLPMRAVTRRAVARVVMLALLVPSAGVAVAATTGAAAFADSSYQMESEFVAKMNAAREANGLRPYTVYGDLTSIARDHSQQMAQRQTLYHNPDLTSEVQNWQSVGENVGEGGSVSDIHNAFMQSPEHRANILDHGFTQVGVGVAVDRNGVIWVTEDFRQPMGASSAPAPSQSGASGSSSSGSSISTAPSLASLPHTGAQPVSGRVAAAAARRQLLARLHAVRLAAARAAGADPVTQAFDYVATLQRLAG
jgi:uncharacterized protein YkwD